MFDGKPRRRQINLGGKKRHEDKAIFVERARRERQARASQRHEMDAIVRIQTCWKKKHQSRQLKLYFKRMVRQQISDIQKLGAMMQSFQFLPIKIIHVLLAELVFCTSSTSTSLEGAKDLNDFCTMVIDHEEWWTFCCLAPASQNQCSSFGLLAQQLVVHVLFVYQSDHRLASGSELNGMLSVLQKITDKAQWKVYPQTREWTRLLCSQTPLSIFHFFPYAFSSTKSTESSPLFKVCIQTLDIILQWPEENILHQDYQHIAEHFIEDVLPLADVDSLWSSISSISSNLWRKIFSQRLVSFSTFAHRISDTFPRGKKLSMASNLISIMESHMHEKNMGDGELQWMIQNIVILLPYLIDEWSMNMICSFANRQTEQSRMNIDHENVEVMIPATGYKIAAQLRSRHLRQFQQHHSSGASDGEFSLFFQKLQVLIRPSFLQSLFPTLLYTNSNYIHYVLAHHLSASSSSVTVMEEKSQDDESNRMEFSIFHQPICHVFRFYRQILAYFGSNLGYRSSVAASGLAALILNDLAFQPSSFGLLSNMWTWIQKRTKNSSSLTVSKSVDASIENAVEHLVFILLQILSHRIVASTDEDHTMFYQQDTPSFFMTLVPFLRECLWNQCAVTSTSSSFQPPFQFSKLSFIMTIIRLYNQLYELNGRKPFVTGERSADIWHWSATQCALILFNPEQSAEERANDVYYHVFQDESDMSFQILTMVPQVLPFNLRLKIFHSLLKHDQALVADQRSMFHQMSRGKIRRDEIYPDSYKLFDHMVQHGQRTGRNELKSRIQITFVNAQGLEEAGVDGGGVFKEYMDTLTKAAFDPQYGLFLSTEDLLLYPNPSSHLSADNHLEQFEFLGRLLGKAVYEEILVEPQFTGFFLNKLLGQMNFINDLQSLDSQMYHNLLSLKKMTSEQVEDLNLTLSMTRNDFGDSIVVDLCPGGQDIAVNANNRIRYIHLVANYKLNIEISQQCRAFLHGFQDLIPTQWIGMFNANELQMIIGGSLRDVNVQDWMKYTVYSGGYHPTQPMMIWFWEIVQEFSPLEKGQLLKFITSCSRQPLLGFSQLNPPICIQQVNINDDQRLPSSSTCMNLLKLPTYSTKIILKQKLSYAIQSKSGFELS